MSRELRAASIDNAKIFQEDNLFENAMSIFCSSSILFRVEFKRFESPKFTAFAISNCVSSSKEEPKEICINLL